MDRLKDRARRALHPRPAVIASLVLASAAGLVWCFLFGGEETPLSYAFYLLSAYALAVVVAAIAPPVQAGWGRVKRTRLVAPIVESEALRSGVSGAWSVLFDLAYAAVVMVNGFRYDSGWAVAVALYHVAIAGLGFALAFGLVRARKLADDERKRRECSMARACGVLLGLMAIALGVVMARMVAGGQAWVYSDIVVITYATFTFVNLVLAVRSAAGVRRVGRPALVASRAVSLSKTLVQLFFLETTMIAVYSAGDQEAFRLVMEGATGAVVFLLVLATAIALVAYATRKLRISSDMPA